MGAGDDLRSANPKNNVLNLFLIMVNLPKNTPVHHLARNVGLSGVEDTSISILASLVQ